MKKQTNNYNSLIMEVEMRNCTWPGNNELMKKYHNEEWCIPSFDESYLFEMLTLEGAQAGLSWSIILAKRDAYQRAFHNFDLEYCKNLTDDELLKIKEEYLVVKNMIKLKSVRSNAIAIEKIQIEFGSFSNFLWKYVNHVPIINQWEVENQMPTQTSISEKISLDLKKRGFKFIGPVIIYSYMQAIGMVDDHIISCSFHTNHRKML